MVMTPAMLAAEMAAAAAGVGGRADMVTRVIAGKVAAAQKAVAPVGATGDTRSTISAQRVDGDSSGAVAWEAGTETWYAHFVEYGTSRQPPRPFIGPAGDMHADEYADAIAEVGDF